MLSTVITWVEGIDTYYITVLHIFHRMFPSVADGGHLLPALSCSSYQF